MRRVFMLLCLSAAVAAGVSCNPENCECPFQSGEETGPDGEDPGKEPEEEPEDQKKPAIRKDMTGCVILITG